MAGAHRHWKAEAGRDGKSWVVKGEEPGDHQHLRERDSRGEEGEADLNYPLRLLRLRSENRGEVGAEDHRHRRLSEQEAGEVQTGSSSPRKAAGRRIWCLSSWARAGSGGIRVGSGEEAGEDHRFRLRLRRNWRCGCEPGSEADRGFWPICRRRRAGAGRGNGVEAAKARGAVGSDWDLVVSEVRLRRLCVLRGVARGVGRVCWSRMMSRCFGD